MKNFIFTPFTASLLVLLFFSASCKKSFLEARPDKSILVPQTIEDMQALMDNLKVMNVTPYYQLVSSDDLNISDAAFLALSKTLRNAYTWQKDTFEGDNQPSDWANPFRQVFYSNIVLDALVSNHQAQALKDHLKGQALFFRAHAIYQLSQEFAKPYQVSTAETDQGIPYPLSPDVNNRPGRKNLQYTYQQMLTDLNEATALLEPIATIKSRPSKAAALALTARIYLIMGDYNKADQAAIKALDINSKLIDYNTLTAKPTTGTRPFPAVLPNGNDEVLFYATFPTSAFVDVSISSPIVVNPSLFELYTENDLRILMFYAQRSDGRVNFKGSYSGSTKTLGSSDFFSGIATDELYLIRAECQARLGNVAPAMNLLNDLLIKRWGTGTFTALSATSVSEALNIILLERRKELVTRELRWSDLRRLNTDPDYAVDLVRAVNGTAYRLPAGDSRYVLPVPAQELATSGIEQN